MKQHYDKAWRWFTCRRFGAEPSRGALSSRSCVGSFPEKIKSSPWFLRGSDKGAKKRLCCSFVQTLRPNTEPLPRFARSQAMTSLAVKETRGAPLTRWELIFSWLVTSGRLKYLEEVEEDESSSTYRKWPTMRKWAPTVVSYGFNPQCITLGSQLQPATAREATWTSLVRQEVTWPLNACVTGLIF